jgi:hypothetical protein
LKLLDGELCEAPAVLSGGAAMLIGEGIGFGQPGVHCPLK